MTILWKREFPSGARDQFPFSSSAYYLDGKYEKSLERCENIASSPLQNGIEYSEQSILPRFATTK